MSTLEHALRVSCLVWLMMNPAAFAIADVDMGRIVSFYSLIHAPENYDNSRVTVHGVVLATRIGGGKGHDEEYGAFLFPSTESARYFLIHESIELETEFESKEQFDKFARERNLKMVEITGDFERLESYGDAFGLLKNITKMTAEVPDRFGAHD